MGGFFLHSEYAEDLGHEKLGDAQAVAVLPQLRLVPAADRPGARQAHVGGVDAHLHELGAQLRQGEDGLGELQGSGSVEGLRLDRELNVDVVLFLILKRTSAHIFCMCNG